MVALLSIKMTDSLDPDDTRPSGDYTHMHVGRPIRLFVRRAFDPIFYPSSRQGALRPHHTRSSHASATSAREPGLGSSGLVPMTVLV